MPYIEIRTVHNVVIAYETGALMDRIFAFVLDQVILIFGCMLLMGLIGAAGIVDSNLLVLCISPFYLFYTLLMESFLDGRTLGKMAMGIKVLKLTGREASFQDYFIRWVFRLVDILFSFGSLASIMISSSKRGQRLGDMLANTVVVRTKEDKSILLNNLSSIRTLDNYEPKYPEAKKLSEEQALLIKNVLDRYKKYPNRASEKMTKELATKLREEFGHTELKQNTQDFLKTLLKDYVVLTR